MKDRLTPIDWTEQIPRREPGWQDLSRIPVIKASHSGMFPVYAITTPVKLRQEGEVTSLAFEVSDIDGSGRVKNVRIDELKTGEIKWPGGLVVEVEFDGLTGDSKHKNKKWSYRNGKWR